jgi:hypothetical protein
MGGSGRQRIAHDQLGRAWGDVRMWTNHVQDPVDLGGVPTGWRQLDRSSGSRRASLSLRGADLA